MKIIIRIRAPDKKGPLMIMGDNFSYFSLKPYVVTPHLSRLDETIQMRGHNICFYAKLTKIIPNYHQILPLIYDALRMLYSIFHHNCRIMT